MIEVHAVQTIEVPCGCVFEAFGEMAMVAYCPGCEAALSGLVEPASCAECGATFDGELELEEHQVLVHLGIERRPLMFVLPAAAVA